jgi:hypothetical protein
MAMDVASWEYDRVMSLKTRGLMGAVALLGASLVDPQLLSQVALAAPAPGPSATVLHQLLQAGPGPRLTGPRVFGWGFDYPDAVVLDGRDLFVANGGDTSVTEINASTGALVTVISAPADQFSGPDAMVRDGHDLFVANVRDSSVTELPVPT